ncbi:MAG TPA: molybdopterin-guanine dinucleotide biosynthesis protein [Clostridiales bacterium]|nr:molybdopterin-guanine dinucleotide biosynthesis protein [Clostridiales bacterium]
MKAISVIGITNSGKTTVCETIIRGLRRRGYSVGSVKEIHFEEFMIDPNPNTNTNRHRAAGSQLVTARGYYETDILYQSKIAIEDILKHYDHDYVILEGVSDCNVPIIITAHNQAEVQDRIDCRAAAVSGVIANSCSDELFGMPVFNALNDPEALVDFAEKRAFEPLPSFDTDCCSGCGCGCREFAGMVARQKAGREECVLFSQAVELSVNGRLIPMVPFVQAILKNTVVGVIRELHGFEEHSKIEVRFKL